MALLSVTVKKARYAGMQAIQLNTYVTLKLQNVKSTTVTVKGPAPSWEQDFLFETNDLNTGLLIEVWNRGVIWDKALGYHWLPLQTVAYSDESMAQWIELEAHLVMRGGEVVGTTGQTGHTLLLDCKFELPFDAENGEVENPVDLQRKFDLLNGALDAERVEQARRQMQYITTSGYSEDSDYTSDLNYPVGQHPNCSASQYRTTAHQMHTPQRSLEVSRENSYEYEDPYLHSDGLYRVRHEDPDPLYYNSRPRNMREDWSHFHPELEAQASVESAISWRTASEWQSAEDQRRPSLERQTTLYDESFGFDPGYSGMYHGEPSQFSHQSSYDEYFDSSTAGLDVMRDTEITDLRHSSVVQVSRPPSRKLPTLTQHSELDGMAPYRPGHRRVAASLPATPPMTPRGRMLPTAPTSIPSRRRKLPQPPPLALQQPPTHVPYTHTKRSLPVRNYSYEDTTSNDYDSEMYNPAANYSRAQDEESDGMQPFFNETPHETPASGQKSLWGESENSSIQPYQYKQPECTQAEFSQPDYTQPDYMQPDHIQCDYAQDNFTKPDYTQTEYMQSGYNDTEYVQTDFSQNDYSQPGYSQLTTQSNYVDNEYASYNEHGYIESELDQGTVNDYSKPTPTPRSPRKLPRQPTIDYSYPQDDQLLNNEQPYQQQTPSIYDQTVPSDEYYQAKQIHNLPNLAQVNEYNSYQTEYRNEQTFSQTTLQNEKQPVTPFNQAIPAYQPPVTTASQPAAATAVIAGAQSLGRFMFGGAAKLGSLFAGAASAAVQPAAQPTVQPTAQTKPTIEIQKPAPLQRQDTLTRPPVERLRSLPGLPSEEHYHDAYDQAVPGQESDLYFEGNNKTEYFDEVDNFNEINDQLMDTEYNERQVEGYRDENILSPGKDSIRSTRSQKAFVDTVRVESRRSSQQDPYVKSPPSQSLDELQPKPLSNGFAKSLERHATVDETYIEDEMPGDLREDQTTDDQFTAEDDAKFNDENQSYHDELEPIHEEHPSEEQFEEDNYPKSQLDEIQTDAQFPEKKQDHVSFQVEPRVQFTAKQRWHRAYNKIVMQLNGQPLSSEEKLTQIGE